METSTQEEALRRYRPYPAYKDSGVEWLGEIPESWGVERADKFLRYEKIQVDPSTIREDLVFHYSIPSIQEVGDGHFVSPNEIDSAKLLITGNRLLVSKLNPRKGVVLLVHQREVATLCSTELVPLKAVGCDPRWSMYLMLAESTRQRLSAVVRSATRSHQRAEVAEITKMWHAVPSIAEQRSIAAFLDRETARIDALVAKKQRLIELLQERRNALINRAVTKGLDSAVPMRDSGVEWLGEIPEHWEIKPFTKYVKERADYRGKTPTKVTTGIFLVTARNIRMGWIDYECSQEFVAEDEYDEIMRRGLPRIDDILFTTEAPLGNVALVDREDIALAQRVIRFRVRPDIFSSQFALSAMMSGYFQAQLKTLSTGSTAEGLKASKLPMLWLVAPPIQEQRAIAKGIQRESEKVGALIESIAKAITRLEELRTALISAAVTGKIDVREEVL